MSEVEPERPGASDDKGVRCENCGRLAGPGFCPHCGQALAARQGPLLQVGREALSDWLALDSRLFRSLRALARPGRLSELYLGGKRAPFLRPFRLYLLASLILFSTILTLESPDATGLNIYLAGEALGAESTDEEVTRTLSFWDDKSFVGRWLIGIADDRIDKLRQMPKQEVVDIIFAGLSRVLPLTLILFVPFLALGLKVLYHPFRRVTRERAVHTLYLDHLVFSLHYQSALFFAAALVWLVVQIIGIEFATSALVYAFIFIAMILVYLPMALRRFYRESRLKTALKTLLVLFVYSRLLGLAIGLSAMYTVWNV